MIICLTMNWNEINSDYVTFSNALFLLFFKGFEK